MPATELTLGVTLAVLGAGLLHAGWNALLKSAPGGDPLLDTATVVAGSGVWGLVGHPVRRRSRCRRVDVHDPRPWAFTGRTTSRSRTRTGQAISRSPIR